MFDDCDPFFLTKSITKIQSLRFIVAPWAFQKNHLSGLSFLLHFKQTHTSLPFHLLRLIPQVLQNELYFGFQVILHHL